MTAVSTLLKWISAVIFVAQARKRWTRSFKNPVVAGTSILPADMRIHESNYVFSFHHSSVKYFWAFFIHLRLLELSPPLYTARFE